MNLMNFHELSMLGANIISENIEIEPPFASVCRVIYVHIFFAAPFQNHQVLINLKKGGRSSAAPTFFGVDGGFADFTTAAVKNT